ncbi:MAG: shikimate dehydrogenase [Nanoarchaeota archaeon]|nr:shikimate dehydrogenase [Nanoarchaeota archaeon]
MLCVPLTVTAKKEVTRFLCAANKHADCIELRLDYFRRKPDLKRLLARCRKPVIVTIRKRAEGGRYGFSSKDRLELYLDAIALDVAYLDVELSSTSLLNAVSTAITQSGSSTQLIVSFHNFRSTDNQELTRVYSAMKKIPGALLKIATHANSIEDNLLMFDLLKRAQKDRLKMIGLCMGDLGQVSRILGLRQGSYLMYAALGKGSAPGQLMLREMKELYRVQITNPHIFGLVGNPVVHSTGYLFHNEQFVRKKKKALYVNFLVRDLKSFLKSFRPLISGLSVTIPYKETIVEQLDSVDKDATAIGAVNTVVRRGRKLRGYNTDFLGVLAALKGVSLKGKQVLVLGAGGVARAACYALMQEKAKVSVVNRTHSKAITLAERMGAEAVPLALIVASPSFDVIINCTSVGMAPEISASPLTLSMLKKISHDKTVVFDTVYTPEHTTLLKYAQSLGLRTVSGVHLFTEQAKAQYHLWRNVL